MRFYGEDWDFCCSCLASRFSDEIEWLNRTLGERGVGWNYYKAKVYFKNEHDRMLFVLKWK